MVAQSSEAGPILTKPYGLLSKIVGRKTWIEFVRVFVCTKMVLCTVSTEYVSITLREYTKINMAYIRIGETPNESASRLTPFHGLKAVVRCSRGTSPSAHAVLPSS